jgi:hypothetical protein
MEQQTVRLRSEQVEIEQTGRNLANQAAATNKEILK